MFKVRRRVVRRQWSVPFETKIRPIGWHCYSGTRGTGDDRKPCVASTLLQVQKRPMTLTKHFPRDVQTLELLKRRWRHLCETRGWLFSQRNRYTLVTRDRNRNPSENSTRRKVPRNLYKLTQKFRVSSINDLSLLRIRETIRDLFRFAF